MDWGTATATIGLRAVCSLVHGHHGIGKQALGQGLDLFVAVDPLRQGLGTGAVNAAARANGMTYNRLIQGLKIAGIEVDRRVLSELATNDPVAFSKLVEIARKNVVTA